MSRIHYQTDGRTVLITMEGDNDLNVGIVSQELYDRLADYLADDELWCAVITGAGGRAFSAGGNLAARASRPSAGENFWEDRPLTLLTGAEFMKPIIAAINGHAIGAGLMLAMACDIRIASENATFGIPEVKLGFPAGQGAIFRLPRMMALGPVMEILLTGDRISSEQAYHWGLVNKVVSREQLIEEAMKLAARITVNPPLAVRGSKELTLRALEMPFEQHNRLQQALTHICRQSEDAEEALRAFAQKRAGQFKGR